MRQIKTQTESEVKEEEEEEEVEAEEKKRCRARGVPAEVEGVLEAESGSRSLAESDGTTNL